MTVNEIKQAVAHGKTVHWSNTAYTVICDKHNQWLIQYDGAGGKNCIGLTWADGTTLNGKEEDFYIALPDIFPCPTCGMLTYGATPETTTVTIPNKDYLLLLDASRRYAEDLASGLDDGMYEEGHEILEELKKIIPNMEIVTVRMPMFLCKDKSGRDMHYEITFDDLAKDEATEDDEFCEWLYNAEVGDEYTEFNNRTYTRTK